MKQGKAVAVLAEEVERQSKEKRDFLADQRQLSMVYGHGDSDKVFGVKVNGHGVFEPNEVFHEQIATRLGIPKQYYDRMKAEAPDLMLANANRWLSAGREKRMVRTLFGKARAFLSDRYRPLDNKDLAEAALRKIADVGAEVMSCELTDRRMYIKAVFPKVEAKILGDTVQSGVVISNSEVGCGSVRVEPLVFKLACLNGMIVADSSVRKFHIGRGGEVEDDGAREFYRDETRKADDAAFWMKVSDIVEATLDSAKFGRIVDRIKRASETELPEDPVEVVKVVQGRYGLSETEGGSVLKHLVRGADLSQWGLVNAITRSSQDATDYDRATDLERLGGEVLELQPVDWERIAKAWGVRSRAKIVA